MPLPNFTKSLARSVRKHADGLRLVDFVLMSLVFAAAAVVIAIAITYVIATQTRLSVYKTPIPLSQKEYGKGEIIKGYFDGQKLYSGHVQITRQLSCNDGYIDTLSELQTGKNYVDSIQPARKIDGDYPRNIAAVPDNVKEGASCIIAFNHSACIPYLFGCYTVEYSYVSLPFTVTAAPPIPPASTDDVDGSTIPDENKGLSPPVINDKTTQNNTAPANNGAVTTPENEPTEDVNHLQEILRSINNGVNDITAPISGTLNDLLGGKKK